MKSKNVFRKIMFIFIFMLLTSGMLSASASTDDYSVIKEPTIENPTFEVEGNPTYQWYEGKMSKITDINASPYILDDTNSEATYDGEWWTSAYNIGPEGTYLNLFFEIEIQEGEEIKVEVADEFKDSVLFLVALNADTLTPMGNLEEIEDGVYLLYDFNLSRMVLGLIADTTNVKVKAEFIDESDSSIKLEGETGSTLSKTELGKEYYCVATYNDGTQLFSNVISFKPRVLQQPTNSNLTIEVSFKELVEKYQWYKISEEKLEITDENSTVFPGVTYNSKTGWTGINSHEGILYFTKEFIEGEKVTITYDNHLAGVDDIIMAGPTTIEAIEKHENELVFEIPVTGEYKVLSNPDYNMNLKISLLETTDEIIEGENSNKLNNHTIGERYFVEVTYNNDVVLKSKVIYMDYAIINNPTSSNLTVGTNCDNDVKKYEWYKVEESDYYTIIDIYTLINGKVNSYLYDGYYSEGKWLSDTGYINIANGVAKDDKVKVTLNEGFDGDVKLYASEYYFEKQEDGSYVYTVTTENSLDIEIIDNNDNPIEATIELIRDGKAYPVVEYIEENFDEESGLYHSSDVDDGYYRNGKWYSEEYEIDIEFDLEEGYTIEVLVGEDFEGFAYINADDEIDLELVNGKFTYTTDGEIQNFEVIIYTEDADFEAIVNILKDDKKYVVSDEKTFLSDMTFIDVYTYAGYYQNNLWYTNENHEIEMEIYVKSGYILTVTPSAEFAGEVIIYNQSSADIILEPSDGVYSYRAQTDQYIIVYLNDSKEFSSKLQLQYTADILLEDQTTKTLNPNSIGKYFVEVTFVDGTKLSSKYFNVDAKVRYEEFGGSQVLDYTGLLVEEAPTTTRVGYIFDGWYSDLEYTKKVEFPYEVIGINTLYAKWIKCNHSQSSVKPTCVDSVTCSACGDIYEKTGHSYKAEYTKNENSHYFECEHCDLHSKEETHQFTDWVLTKSATRKEEGLEQRACRKCGHLESRTVEATGLETGAIIGIVSGSVGTLLTALGLVYWFVFRRRLL